MTDSTKPLVSLVDLLAASQSHSAFSKEGQWDFLEIAEALQSNYLNSFGYAGSELADFIKVMWPNRVLVIHTLFDIPHDSDESCSATILTSDGKPVLLFKKIGDRSNYSDGLEILDAEFTRQLIHLVADYHLQETLQRVKSEPLATVESIVGGSQYIIPAVGDVFIVDSPKWALGFPSLFKEHSAWLVDDDGALHRVGEFKRWLSDKPSWSGDALAGHAIVETQIGDVTVNCRQILFTLTKEPLSMVALQESANLLRAALNEKARESDRQK